MTLYLLRHASAGRPLPELSADQGRALDPRGRAQAQLLVAMFAGRQITELRSSPLMRCTQTLVPLAQERGVAITPDAAFAEGADPLVALEHCAALPAHTVVCSHGDVIPEVITAMLRRGLEVKGPTGFRKASVWVLDRDATGAFTRGAWWDRPEI